VDSASVGSREDINATIKAHARTTRWNGTQKRNRKGAVRALVQCGLPWSVRGMCYNRRMGVGKQSREFRETEGPRRGAGSATAALLLLSSLLSGCSSSWSNPPQSAGNSPGAGLPPPANSSARGQVPTPAAPAPVISDGVHPNQSLSDLFRGSASSSPDSPISDGVHPNQSLSDLFRDSASSSPNSPISDGVHPNQSLSDLFRGSASPQANVPRPPSSYTPVGQPYSPPGQPSYGASQTAPGTPTAVAAAPPAPSASDGVHPNQSISDLFHQ
jgi:hypothetical protein